MYSSLMFLRQLNRHPRAAKNASEYSKLRRWLVEHGWTASPFGECFFFRKEKRLIVSVYIDECDILEVNQQAIPDKV